MGRKSRLKKDRAPKPDRPDRAVKTPSGAVEQIASDAGPQVQSRYMAPAVCGLLLLAVLAVFGQTAYHDFVNYDDDEYVYQNPHVNAGLTGKGIAWAITAYHAANWHPLTWL